MIYFIDEDTVKLDAWVWQLRAKKYDVSVIDNADQAYDVLIVANDVDLVFIDVMLAVDILRDNSRYGRERTASWTLTGLVLLDDLVAARPEVFPARATILTNAGANQRLLSPMIRASCAKHGVEWLKKPQILSAFEFLEKVEAILGGVSGRVCGAAD